MKRILISVLTLIVATAMNAEVYTGTCGENLTWKLDTSEGVFEIEGSGDMTDYQISGSSPWYDYRSSIKSIIIGDNVTSVGDYAFNNTELTSLSIGNGVKSIGKYAFSDSRKLESLTIPSSIEIIKDYAFAGCWNLSSLSLGDNLKTIGEEAFSDCISLTELTIPDNVTYIGYAAFAACSSIKTITIGKSVGTIEKDAFGFCYDLETVLCYAENVPNTSVDAFEDSGIEYVTLYVPSSAIDDYMSTLPWSLFKMIKDLSGVVTEVSSLQIMLNISPAYDLQGRKVTNAQNGIYIINGKKVLK